MKDLIIMENRKLYGRYDEKAGTYTLPKNAPPEHALIAADIDRAAEIASGIKESIDTTSGVPKGLMFIHEGNGVKFHICTNYIKMQLQNLMALLNRLQ
jgi:hypothetical protein